MQLSLFMKYQGTKTLLHFKIKNYFSLMSPLMRLFILGVSNFKLICGTHTSELPA